MGPDGACGILSFAISRLHVLTLPQWLVRHAVPRLAYANLMPDLTQAAGKLAKIDLDYQNYYYRSADPGSGPIPPRPAFVSAYCTQKGLAQLTVLVARSYLRL